jgi:hypothetical protein
MPNQTGHETKLNFGKDDNSTMLQINLSMEIKFPRGTKKLKLQGLAIFSENSFSGITFFRCIFLLKGHSHNKVVENISSYHIIIISYPDPALNK